MTSVVPLPALGAFFQPACLCSPFLACSLPASTVCSVVEVLIWLCLEPSVSVLSSPCLCLQPLPPRAGNSQMPHLVSVCSNDQARTFLPGMGTWDLCRVFSCLSGTHVTRQSILPCCGSRLRSQTSGPVLLPCMGVVLGIGSCYLAWSQALQGLS